MLTRAPSWRPLRRLFRLLILVSRQGGLQPLCEHRQRRTARHTPLAQLQRIHTPRAQLAVRRIGLWPAKPLGERLLGQPSLHPRGPNEVEDELILGLVDGLGRRHAPLARCGPPTHALTRII